MSSLRDIVDQCEMVAVRHLELTGGGGGGYFSPASLPPRTVVEKPPPHAVRKGLAPHPDDSDGNRTAPASQSFHATFCVPLDWENEGG